MNMKNVLNLKNHLYHTSNEFMAFIDSFKKKIQEKLTSIQKKDSKIEPDTRSQELVIFLYKMYILAR